METRYFDIRCPPTGESTECLIKAKLRVRVNAADLERTSRLRVSRRVGYVLNVTREVDNFFPETMEYLNSRSKCLVHCQMGVSRSVATVMAYAMREPSTDVKQKRDAAQPNSAFLRQLAEYEGILDPGWVVVEVVEVEVVRWWWWRRTWWRWSGGGGGGGGGTSAQQNSGGPRPETRRPRTTAGASGLDTLEVSGEETPVLTSSSQEEEEAWGGGCSSGMSLEVEPLDPLNYNYYFRRLSDSALESGPSTPVRGPPLLGMERIFIEIEDVERDALLEDEGGGGGAFPGAHLAPGGAAAAAAQTCGRLDPMEDVRLRLEFSTLEEEDEEEAQKEEAEMEALARASRGPGDPTEGRLGLANLNTNNSNRLGSKRSCPAAFDDSLGSQNPFKVKPSYRACPECHRRPHGWRTHRLYTSRLCSIPSITLDPPRVTSSSSSSTSSSSSSVTCTLPCGHRCRCTTCRPAVPVSPAATAASAAASLDSSSPSLVTESLAPEAVDGAQEIQYDEEEVEEEEAEEEAGPGRAELAGDRLVGVEESAAYSTLQDGSLPCFLAK
ncbi:hypothetical protein CRUP_029291 [Coryphaenoides rupestris]|nr:hypothetical protein CRUP_029291 [Coryphaenoides rupestris]